MLLQDHCEAVLCVANRDELLCEVVKFARRSGFDLASAIAVYDHPTRPTEFVVVDNTPQCYLELSNSPERYRKDPVAQLGGLPEAKAVLPAVALMERLDRNEKHFFGKLFRRFDLKH